MPYINSPDADLWPAIPRAALLLQEVARFLATTHRRCKCPQLHRYGTKHRYCAFCREAQKWSGLLNEIADMVDGDPGQRWTVCDRSLSLTTEVYHDRSQQRPDRSADRPARLGATD